MKTITKHIALWVSMVIGLAMTMPAEASLLPDGNWYVFGDTVSMSYPRITFTNVVKQITKTEYDNKTYGSNVIYSTDGTYYFYSATYQDTTYLVFSAQKDDNGEYQIVGYGGRANSLNDLWYIVDVTPDADNIADKYWPRDRVRMRAQNLLTKQWISYTTNSDGEVVLTLVNDSAKSSQFGYYMDSDEPYYHEYNTDRATSFLPVFYDASGNSYFMQSEAKDKDVSIEGSMTAGTYMRTERTKDFQFKLDRSASRFMLAYQWTAENAISFEIEANQVSTLLGYAKDDVAAKAQKVTQEFHVTLTDSTNLYCVYARNKGLALGSIMLLAPAIENNATNLIKKYGLDAQFYWASNGKGSYTNMLSPLEKKQIDNTLSNVAAYQNEQSRNMLTRGKATHNGGWSIEVTPEGASPYNVVDTTKQSAGTPVNYDDFLVCDIMDKNGNVLGSFASQFVRVAYRQIASTDSIYVTVNPVNPMLDAAGGTAEFTYSFEEVKTEIRYTAAGTIDSVYTNEHTAVTMKELDKVQFVLRTEDNQDFSGDWIKDLKVDTANSKVTFKYANNDGANMRGVKLVCTATRGNYHSTSFNYIQQYTSTKVGQINFVHTKGGYANLMPENARGIQYQKVHTIEKTIYYKAGEEIAFVANEPCMRGYWRWYDYDSDLDPQYYMDNGTLKTTSNFWKTLPQDKNGNQFTAINQNEPSGSRGYYCTNSSGLPGGADVYQQQKYVYPTKMIPKINAWSDKQKRNIALDASAYQDFTISSTEIQEPTLSYRQIWHLLPAEDMADSLMKCTSVDNPYEMHEYIALTGQNVYLATNLPHYAFSNHQSELSYWYYTSSGDLKQIGKVILRSRNNTTAKWKKRESTDGGVTYGAWSSLDDNYTNDYQNVNSSTAKVIQYALYVAGRNTRDGNDLYIATFTVTYVPQSQYGPSSKELMSRTEVSENYKLLAEQDFNFGTKAGSLTTNAQVFYPNPLDAENSSFGFLYINANGESQRNRQKPGGEYPWDAQNFAYFGEYCLVNKITSYDWAKGEQHGGAANGYMMYVDGKMQPGLVATISTDAQLCSGQQMYCYIWIANPQTGSALPIFRFDVQGRNSNSEAWTSVGAFFAGSIPVQSGWLQVNFPVVSKENYAQTRIAVYNFATDVSGNDFFIDDVCLYATKLPLQAYQAFTSCEVEDMKVAVVRVDYDNMTSTASDQVLYYTIVNTADNNKMVKTVYHYPSNWSGTQSGEYGAIYIPQKGYDPTTNLTTSLGDESKEVFGSASQMIDSLETLYEKDKSAGKPTENGYQLKGYVKTSDKNGDRYILYVAHLVSNANTPSTGKYMLNMATNFDELKNPECALSAELSIQNKTEMKFGDGETTTRLGACANGLYPVTVNVNNTIEIDGTDVTLSGLAKADWLVGYEFDDVYDPDDVGSLTNEKKEKADAAFEAKYGYTRGKVQDALQELRRYPNISNYTASNLSQIVLDTIGTDGNAHNVLLEEHYKLIADLYNRNLLKLYRDSDQFYLRQQDTLRYWIFPIAGTAQVKYKGTQYTLDNCSNRTFFRAYTGASDHTVNVSPIAIENMTDEQRHAIPRVRVAAKNANTAFRVPVTEITDRVVFGLDSCRVVSSTDPMVQELIDGKAGVDKFSMRYTQDRIYQDVKEKYYTNGDTIVFRPVDAAHVTAMQKRHNTETGWGDNAPGFWHTNTHSMRAGYEYTMMVTLLNKSLSTHDKDEKGVDAACPIGTVYFTVVVVPDTVIWSPMVSDYWGDDENWRGIINGQESENGMVPLAETDVVIATQSDVRKYPYLCDSVFYPMDAHYVTAKCHKILFQSKTTMLNQQKLEYDSAYVDMTLNKGSWYSVAMPLKDVYSGDFFVPHSGANYADAAAKNLESTDYFTVSSFKGTRDASAAYAAWSTYYNDSVKTVHYSPNGNYNSYNKLQGDGDLVFFSSNVVDKKIDACGGLQLGVWGPDNLTDDQITIRLPKPDTKYYMYRDGVVKDSATVDRSQAHQFAFEPDKNGQMKVKLHNETKSEWFIWGNPTMAYVDAEAFYFRNSDKIESNYKVMVDGEWKARNRYNVTYQSRLVAPFESVLVYTKRGEKLNDLELVLDVRDLATSNMNGGRTNYHPSTQTSAPKRVAHSKQGHYLNNGLMHIAAGVRYAGDMKNAATASFDLVATDFANNGFDISEDALFVSTGVADDGTIRNGASEMNMYSLVGNKGLSIDVREEIDIVPLGFLVSNDMRDVNNGQLTLYFTLTDWEQECYLVDVQTGAKTRIINGTEITVDIPQNHEMRYYIQGPEKASSDDDTPTDNQNVVDTTDGQSAVSVFSPAAGLVNVIANSNIAMVRLYDVTGQTIAEQKVSGSPVLTMAAPAGILVAEVKLENGTIAREKVLVR